jgi:hypothetical protein
MGIEQRVDGERTLLLLVCLFPVCHCARPVAGHGPGSVVVVP